MAVSRRPVHSGGLRFAAHCIANGLTSRAPSRRTSNLVAPASWQWQLTELPIDSSFDAEMYDIDLFDNDAGTVAALHAQGRKVICYLSAGSWEEWRPDASQFPDSVLGNDYEGWSGERWLDIHQIDLLAPIMSARLDQCRAKGFEGVELDAWRQACP